MNATCTRDANPRRDPEPTDLSATRARADKEATT